ncbi:MAG: thiamine phosphate synthase [Devosia sp.]
MNVQFFLVAPPGTEPAQFMSPLKSVLATAAVSALLLPREGHTDASYKVLAKAVIPVAQAANCAVLIEGEAGLVKALGADGLQVSGDIGEVKAAIAALKPHHVVGAASIASRHDAMSKGELGPDYLFFGPTSGIRDPEQREMARWWAEIFEIPAVLSDPLANAETAASEGAEFIALGESLWAASDPAAMLAKIAEALKVAA